MEPPINRARSDLLVAYTILARQFFSQLTTDISHGTGDYDNQVWAG